MTNRRRFIQTLAALPAVLCYRPTRAASDPSRLALIIGNSTYHDAPLINPANDARAVGGLFTQAGFSVDQRLNATRGDMLDAIERFGAAIKRPETKLVVFYYAGHGAQLDWRNYLLPVDAVVEKQEHMKQRCIDLNLLLGQLSAAKDKTFVIILDACRNNPFGTAYRPEQQGLSQFDAPVGSLLAYATSPGNVASDGAGANGLYTENLVRELSQRNTRIEDALKRVRLNVRLASHGEQIPWETTSLESDVFIFSEGQKQLSEAELEKLVEADVTEWARIKSSKKVDDWVTYLRSFPNGRFAEIAQMRLTRLLAEIEQAAAEKRRQEELRKQEELKRLEQERQRLAEERKQQERQRLLAEQKRMELAAEKRRKEQQEEQQRLDQQRTERERIRLAEAQRLAAERKHLDEQLLLEQRRRQEEQQRMEAQRRLEQEGVERERLRIAEAERTRLQQPPPEAKAKPAAAGAPPSGVSAIDLGAGLAVPLLIAPSANPFSAGRYPLARIYTVGDTATMRQTDILTGIEERLFTMRVTKVDYEEDRVEFNHGGTITDLMGNVLKSGQTEYDTPTQFTPAEFQAGKKWTAAFHRIRNGATSNVSFDMRIVARETIAVPAGSFDTFRIEGVGWNMTKAHRREVKFWLVPGLNFPVRSESVTRDKRGRFTETVRRELVSLRQQTFDTKCAASSGGVQRNLSIKSNCAA